MYSDKEQELNDLNDLHDRFYSLSEEVDDIFSDIHDKYGLVIFDRLQVMALEVKEKSEELSNSERREDAILDREGL